MYRSRKKSGTCILTRIFGMSLFPCLQYSMNPTVFSWLSKDSDYVIHIFNGYKIILLGLGQFQRYHVLRRDHLMKNDVISQRHAGTGISTLAQYSA